MTINIVVVACSEVSLSEVSLSEVSLSEVSLSEVSLGEVFFLHHQWDVELNNPY